MATLLWTIAGLLFITATLAYYFVIIKSEQDEKALKQEEKKRTAYKYFASGLAGSKEGNYNRLETLEDFE